MPPSPTTFGATIERRQPSTELASPPHPPSNPALESTQTSLFNGPSATPPAPNPYTDLDFTSNPANPFSAFYQHPSTRSSLERAKAESRTQLPIMPHRPLADLESGNAQKPSLSPPEIIVTEQPSDAQEASSSLPQSRNTSTDGGGRSLGGASSNSATRPNFTTTRSRSSVWPTRQELEEKALISKRERMKRNWNCLGGLSKRQRIWVRVLIALIIIAAAVGIGVGVSMAVGGGVYKGNGQQGKIPDDG